MLQVKIVPVTAFAQNCSILWDSESKEISLFTLFKISIVIVSILLYCECTTLKSAQCGLRTYLPPQKEYLGI